MPKFPTYSIHLNCLKYCVVRYKKFRDLKSARARTEFWPVKNTYIYKTRSGRLYLLLGTIAAIFLSMDGYCTAPGKIVCFQKNYRLQLLFSPLTSIYWSLISNYIGGDRITHSLSKTNLWKRAVIFCRVGRIACV